MTFLVHSVQACVDLPLVLDTTNHPMPWPRDWRPATAGQPSTGYPWSLRNCSASCPWPDRPTPTWSPYLLRPDGHVPADAAGRMEAAVQLFAECEKAGIAPERLIFDPIVAPLTWQDGNRQNMAVLKTIRTLSDLLGVPVRTIAGLSNLTTGAPDATARKRYQHAFLPMLADAGTDFILMNVLDPDLMRTVEACRNITAGSVFSWQ